MKTRRHLFRSASAAVLTVLALARLLEPTASATGLPVLDVAGIAQVAKEAEYVSSQLQSMQQQVQALRSAALQLDPRSYRSVQNLLSGNEVNYQSLIRDVQSMGYSLDRVNTRFRQLYPDDAAVKKMRPDQLEATSRDMNKEIHASALVAARSQTTLRDIEQNNTEARNILSRSQGNGSQVAQLQSAIQMLGLIHQTLVGINQTMSTAGHVERRGPRRHRAPHGARAVRQDAAGLFVAREHPRGHR